MRAMTVATGFGGCSPDRSAEKTGVSLPRFVWMQGALPLEQNQQWSLHKEYP